MHHELREIGLEVRGLSCGKLYQDVSFEVRRCEVLGCYGLVGAGRTEIAETLFGLRDPDAGEILLDGDVVRLHSPAAAIARGISLVPEDRKGQGRILGMNCCDNMTLPRVEGVDKAWGSCGAFFVCDGQPAVNDSGPCDGNAVSSFRRPPHHSTVSHAGIGNVID